MGRMCVLIAVVCLIALCVQTLLGTNAGNVGCTSINGCLMISSDNGYLMISSYNS